MTNRPWPDVRRDLRKIVFRRGYKEVAEEIPAHRTTVYRLVNGVIQEPSKALRKCVEDVIKREDAESH